MAQINIYENCTDEKPVKTYTCRRVLLGLAHKATDIIGTMEGKSYNEQLDIIGNIVRLVFPEITDKEVECIDPAELQQFFKDIIGMVQGKLEIAQKN